MAVDIPELDQPGEPGLLRKKWFPLVMTDPATFNVVLLLAASNYLSLATFHPGVPSLYAFKQNAITSVNEALRDPKRHLSDQVIGAVAKLASYEAMFGDRRTFDIHMAGLQKMVLLRGGLDRLGLSGLLERIVLWIDNNSAFLYNSARLYFLSEPSFIPNPSHFLGAS